MKGCLAPCAPLASSSTIDNKHTVLMDKIKNFLFFIIPPLFAFLPLWMTLAMLYRNMVAFLELMSNFRLDFRKEIEGKEFLMQEALDTTGLRLHEKDPALAKEVRRLIMMRQELTFKNIERVPG